jgi:hypothetical protein
MRGFEESLEEPKIRDINGLISNKFLDSFSIAKILKINLIKINLAILKSIRDIILYCC